MRWKSCVHCLLSLCLCAIIHVYQKTEAREIEDGADILCALYSNELWKCRWNEETAIEQLNDFFSGDVFAGLAAVEKSELVAGLFTRVKMVE